MLRVLPDNRFIDGQRLFSHNKAVRFGDICEPCLAWQCLVSGSAYLYGANRIGQKDTDIRQVAALHSTISLMALFPCIFVVVQSIIG